MFGMLRPAVGEMRRAERKRYRRVYCGICRRLSKDYGLIPRLLLAHDVASLAWLIQAHQPRRDSTSQERADRFLASISAILCEIKVKDDFHDDKSLRAKLLLRLCRRTFAKAKRNLAEDDFDLEALHAILDEQSDVEQRDERNIDLASQPSGQAYGLVARHIASTQDTGLDGDVAETMGRHIGRSIFLIDAYRDYSQDAGVSYNPLRCCQDPSASSLPTPRRRETFAYVCKQLDAVSQLALGTSPAVADRWSRLDRQLRRTLGLEPQPVVLNAMCCFPCGDGAVACDSNDLGWECCVVCILGMWCCVEVC